MVHSSTEKKVVLILTIVLLALIYMKIDNICTVRTKTDTPILSKKEETTFLRDFTRYKCNGKKVHILTSITGTCTYYLKPYKHKNYRF